MTVLVVPHGEKLKGNWAIIACKFDLRLTYEIDELQGRVNSAYRLLALSAPPLGYFLAGLLLQGTGPRPTIVLFLACLLLLALLATGSRVLRKAEYVPYQALTKDDYHER